MGLDAWAFATERRLESDVDFDCSQNQQDSELGYWRNCFALHAFMAELYYEKGGQDNAFNCNPVCLTLEDLDDVSRFQRDNAFSDMEEAEIEVLTQFIEKAKDAINNGQSVYYDSWW